MSEDNGKVVLMPGCGARAEQPDLSPAFIDRWNEMIEGFHEVMDKALEDGMPIQMILGQLDLCKAHLVESMYAIMQDGE